MESLTRDPTYAHRCLQYEEDHPLAMTRLMNVKLQADDMEGAEAVIEKVRQECCAIRQPSLSTHLHPLLVFQALSLRSLSRLSEPEPLWLISSAHV